MILYRHVLDVARWATLHRTLEDGQPLPIAAVRVVRHAAADPLPDPGALALLVVSGAGRSKGHHITWREMAQNDLHLWHR